MILQLFVSVMVGALLWMDRVFVAQVMVSRPVVMGPVVSLASGNLETGLLVGASLELLWLNSPPVGAYLPEDESFCTAVAACVAAAASQWMPMHEAAGLSIVGCLPCAVFGRVLDTWLRRRNEGLVRMAGPSGTVAVSRMVGTALVRAYSMAAASVALCVAVCGSAAYAASLVLPRPISSALTIVPFVCVVAGITGLVNQEKPVAGAVGLFGLGFACMVLIAYMSLI